MKQPNSKTLGPKIILHIVLQSKVQRNLQGKSSASRWRTKALAIHKQEDSMNAFPIGAQFQLDSGQVATVRAAKSSLYQRLMLQIWSKLSEINRMRKVAKVLSTWQTINKWIIEKAT